MDLAVQLLNLNPSCPGLEGIMGLELADFQKIRGIGRVKAVQLAAVCELSRRMTRIQFSESYAFTTPQSIADYYMAYMCRLGHEEVHVMMLDTKQHMIYYKNEPWGSTWCQAWLSGQNRDQCCRRRLFPNEHE